MGNPRSPGGRCEGSEKSFGSDARNSSESTPSFQAPTRVAAADYRVPPGRIALTLDFQGHDPRTIEISDYSLVGVLDGVAELVGWWPYQRALQMLGGVYRELARGRAGAENGMLLGFWLALNHPKSGDEMRAQVADRMASGRPVHITMHAAQGRGIAFALGDQFIDLADVLRAAKTERVGVMMAAEPRRARRPAQ